MKTALREQTQNDAAQWMSRFSNFRAPGIWLHCRIMSIQKGLKKWKRDWCVAGQTDLTRPLAAML